MEVCWLMDLFFYKINILTVHFANEIDEWKNKLDERDSFDASL